jgi:acyl-CoA synthetase (AMP-forming)/AMP-acid ligase II
LSLPPQIGALLDATVSESPERPALAYGDTELTYRQLASAVDRLAARLGDWPGERVAVVAPNVPALVVALFAVWRAGAVAVPLSARLRSFELRRVFADAQPSAVVSVASHGRFSLAEELDVLSRSVPALTTRIIVDGLGGIEHETRSPSPEAAQPLGADLAAIMYTSGTTGEPKGALMSHALGVAEGRCLRDLLGASAGAACGLLVPGSHAFGLACLLCSVAAGGQALLVDSATSLEPLAQAMRRHRAPVLHGTPALFARLLKGHAELPVQSGFIAGSSCPPDILEELDRRGARILNLYGMTEIGCAACCRADDPPEVRYRTVGRALLGYDLRVAGGAGEHGPQEIQVRGPYVTDGYHGRPRERDEAFDGEWFCTGDLGTFDAAGNLSVVGRAKEVVHVGGFNVFPAEVENFLLTHPDVNQAAVIGVSHPTMGEALHAFVVPRPQADLATRDVVRFARAGIAGYKVPYGVSIVAELPLLASGKPDRRALARSIEPREALV